MALTAGSLAGGSLNAAAGYGPYPSPFTLSGYLNGTSTSYSRGDLLINTSGTLDEAAAVAVGNTLLGILAEVGPRRQDMAPLTSGTAPAAALPGQRTTPSAGAPNYANAADMDFGALYYPYLPGNLFVGHLTDEDAGGTDVRANAATDIFRVTGYSYTVLSGAAADEVDYATRAGIWVLCFDLSAQADITRIVNYVNPQFTTVPGGTFTAVPGPIVQNGGATGTFNPFVVYVPIESAWFNLS